MATPRIEHCARVRGGSEQSRGQRGAGLLSSVFGLGIFLAFLLLAVQLLYSLHATSVLTSAGYDAGRHLARTGDPELAAQRFESATGGYDATIDFELEGGTTLGEADTVIVTIRGTNPTLIPDKLAGPLPFVEVERTLRIRNERLVE